MELERNFKETGFVVARNLVDLSEIARLYEYTLKNLHLGNMDDGQVPGSPAFYQDKEMMKLHQSISPQIEALTNLKLFSTFCYHRTYRKGSVLRSHKDRNAAEIVVSLNIGQKGEPWDFWLLDSDENARNILLTPGDAIIYQGCNITHWRGKLVNADLVSQVIFCYIDQNGRKTLALTTELLNKFLLRCRKYFGIAY